uniref:Photosystem II n=1 Tax=Opuntia streptacantha TaxID=393608 RepID=A0A7C8ZE13_OPUST
MASISAVSVATPFKVSNTFSPLPVKTEWAVITSQKPKFRSIKVQASRKEKAVSGLTAAALTAAMVVPDVAEAAELTPSLKNFLLSIVAGGVVLGVLLGAVIAVANFDPVKRV